MEKLNEVIIKTETRSNGSLRISYDYSNCPTLTEQHSGYMTDVNYLMEKYQPDELAAYIAARNQYRTEILNHDFSGEPSLTDAKNLVYKLQTEFQKLPPEIKSQFKSHVEFLKFIDNPANQEKMIKLGLMTKKEIAANTVDQVTPTQEKEPKKPS